MANIIINGVEMPPTKKIQYSETELSTVSTTADGTDYVDVVGYRTEISCEWDSFPQEKLSQLLAIKGFVMCSYPDISGTTKSEKMRISVRPTPSVFRFGVSGVPVWHGISITLTARAVK